MTPSRRPFSNRSGGGMGGKGGLVPRVKKSPFAKPPLVLETTTLWEYPSQHYTSRSTGGDVGMQGDSKYVGATPSWVIWQLLERYTREGDVVLDPMCGSGTTIDVAQDLGRRGLGCDVNPTRADIKQADAREIPLADESVDFVFIDPPYSTHVNYSDDPRCIGKLDSGGEDHGREYYRSMGQVFAEAHRVLRDRRYMGVYVSDSWKKGSMPQAFMPIGFELFAMLRTKFVPVDIVAVVRQNAKLKRSNWHKAAAEGNFFMRGFNYFLIMKKDEGKGK